ncbi:MAG: hypothetical protein KF819_38455 [Labilithrix sp.]|nr:hypothetical protein [Labilithrix sp.]
MRRLAVLLSLLAACDRGCACDRAEHARDASDAGKGEDGERTAAEADGGALLGGTADVSIALGADAAHLRHAAIFADDEGLEVVLTTTPVGCPGPMEPPVPYLSFPIPPGPGGSWYAGSTIGTETFLHFGDEREALFAGHLATLTLAADAGATIRGSIALDIPDAGRPAKASGTFASSICRMPRDDDAGASALPLRAPSEPFAVRYGKQSLQVTSAIANVESGDDPPFVREIIFSFARPELLDNEPVPPSARFDMTVTLRGAAARDQRALLLTPQPIRVTLGARGDRSRPKDRGLGSGPWSGSGPGWIRIDRADMRSGGRVEGEIAFRVDGVVGAAEGGGRFSATVD